ncbi:hypothetical protein GDO81_024308 [Engystomops pustulosus]|uniref:Uncharacterized protein n=1 Tax=Engystomops pustulosus TaxID=76066 RepID=A0AAV6YK62_ENGPU|nr:hypothetical protein GDO81_024308 [Engystomops pustulosus]
MCTTSFSDKNNCLPPRFTKSPAWSRDMRHVTATASLSSAPSVRGPAPCYVPRSVTTHVPVPGLSLIVSRPSKRLPPACLRKGALVWTRKEPR